MDAAVPPPNLNGFDIHGSASGGFNHFQFFLGTSLALFATPEFWHGREQEKRFPGYTAYSKRDRLVNDGGIGFPSNEAFGPEHINSAG